MADGGYIAVYEKSEARIYDGMTTTITASKDPLLVAPRCAGTGLWKLDLDYEVLGREYPEQFIAGVNAANAIFDLPVNCQTLMYYHAAAGFPTKETFLSTVRTGNFATWLGLTTTLVSKYFPDSKETQKGHMKGQQKGIQSTKVRKPVEKITGNRTHTIGAHNTTGRHICPRDGLGRHNPHGPDRSVPHDVPTWI
jgi:hypothetical protein